MAEKIRRGDRLCTWTRAKMRIFHWMIFVIQWRCARMLTIRDAFERLYLVNRPGLGQRTICRYQYEIQRWERLAGNPPLNQISTETFNRFRSECLNHGLRPSSVEGGIRTILQILRLCGPPQERRQGLGLIQRVPYVGPPLRCTRLYKPTPTVEDLRAAWKHAGKAIWPRTGGVTPEHFWRAFLGVEFVTGLRLANMLSAARKHLTADVLTATAHKTSIAHVFPIPPWLLPLLYLLPEWQGKLFPCRSLPHFIRRELRRICSAAGIPTITPHGIRRASITEWSALNSDCGSIIHGQGLGIRSRYVDPLRLLRKHLPDFPSLTE
jgi:integrase